MYSMTNYYSFHQSRMMASTANGLVLKHPSTDPPHYQSVEDTATGIRGLSNSLAFAGNSISRFFGVHGDKLVGWRRNGTLPPAQCPPYTPLETDPIVHVPNESDTAVKKNETKLWNMCKPLKDEIIESFPTYWPIFTIASALIEIALVTMVMVTNSFAPVQFTTKIETSDIAGFGGVNLSVTKSVLPNPFAGPSKAAMIHAGAKYPVCMRNSPQLYWNTGEDDRDLICCQEQSTQQCGMLPENVCLYLYHGDIIGGVSQCNAQEQSGYCSGGVVLHPCCVGIEGQCILTTEENCTFQEGYWHPEKLLCSELGSGCFRDICRLDWINRTLGQVPDQGIRFISAIFLYCGILEFVMVFFPKFYTNWKIERRIGWLRLSVIYLLSGVGGLLVSSIFDPEPAVGNSGAMYGLLGVMLVELLQGWKWVRKPRIELLKLVGFLVLLFGAGTLPYVDNFCHIGGFVFGALASFVFVPYISIGEWERLKKLCLILALTPIMLSLLVLGFAAFYNFTDPDFCHWCTYLNCIPYTSTLCDI